MRRVFAIVLNDPNEAVAERISAKYPGAFKLSDTFFLVSGKTISAHIAAAVGIKGVDRIEDVLGVVFKLNDSYSGYNSRSLWEWLNQVEKEE